MVVTHHVVPRGCLGQLASGSLNPNSGIHTRVSPPSLLMREVRLVRFHTSFSCEKRRRASHRKILTFDPPSLTTPYKLLMVAVILLNNLLTHHEEEGVMLQISRLLIVDDDPLVLTLLSQLTTAHFEQVLVETTDSPYVALDRIKTTAYDVVISDIQMPGMDGLDLATRITAMSPCTSIVLISGALDHSDQVWSCDIFAYLEKPIDCDLFLRTVAQAIQKGRPQCLTGKEAKAIELALYAHGYGD